MKQEEIERLQKLDETRKRQYKKQNEFVREKYDRVSLTLPKGTKDEISDLTGMAINTYINALVAADLKERKAAAALAELEKKRSQKKGPEPEVLDQVFDDLNPPEDPEPEPADQGEIIVPGMTPEQIAGIDFRKLKTDIMYQLELLDQLGEKKFQAVVDIFSKNRG